ncbi:hypothetical protein ACFX2C_045784 [Malus domestica]
MHSQITPDSAGNITAHSSQSSVADNGPGGDPRAMAEAFTFSNLSHSDAKEFPLSSSLNGLTGLQQLELQANLLSGEFPELGSLHNLSYLDAINNAISGGVPLNFPAFLLQISMRNNNLVGNIPKNIKKLGFLQVLNLSHNQLGGAVPTHLFNHRFLLLRAPRACSLH